MESEDLYDEVASRAINKMQRINKLLSYCEIDSKFAEENTEEMFVKIFDVNTDEIVIKENFNAYYDLTKISSLINTLDLHGKSAEAPKKKVRADSITSLASEDNNRDYILELKSHLKDMREVVKGIENSSIEILDEESCMMRATTKSNKFLELVFALQRLAKEVNSIAATDNISPETQQLSIIDDKFINHLSQLDKCLDEMQRLNKNKNPITNLENRGNLQLEFTQIINNILEIIEINQI